MEDKVFNTLLKMYKARGLSFEHLLRNPVFVALPIEAKVRLLNAHAKELADGVRVDSTDVKNILGTLGWGLAAAGTAYQVSSWLSKNKTADNPLLAAALTIASSLPVTKFVEGLSTTSSNLAYKDKLRNYLNSDMNDEQSIALMGSINGLKQHAGIRR